MISLIVGILKPRSGPLAAMKPGSQTAQPYEPWRDSPGAARRRERLAAERETGRF